MMTASPVCDAVLEVAMAAQRAGLPHDVVYAGPVKMEQLKKELAPFLPPGSFELEQIYFAGLCVVRGPWPGLACGWSASP